MKKLFFSILLILVMNLIYSQQDIQLEPKGIFSEIDVKKCNDIIILFSSNDFINKNKVIDIIIKHPNDFDPRIFYFLSNELFKKGKKEDAAFWFYVGQLKARIDANICADLTAGEAVDVLNNNFGEIINKYTFKNIPLLEKVMIKVIAFVKNSNENYDRRWINLHGIWAVKSSLDDKFEVPELSLPKEQWASIKEKTINDYEESFKEVITKIKK
jgi:hypothetical protein